MLYLLTHYVFFNKRVAEITGIDMEDESEATNIKSVSVFRVEIGDPDSYLTI